MGSGIFSIGVTAVQSAQIGLMTTEHNISNVNTPGYSRQRILQATNIAVLSGSGYVGQGSHVTTVERMYSSFIGAQVNRAQTNVSQLQSYSTELGQINNMLADDSAGLSPAMQSFFKGIQQVAADPTSLTARQSMVSGAQAMTARYQALDQRLVQQYEGVNTQIQGNVASINSYAQQISNLNEQIITAESSMGQPPNDLYDQRDQIVADLNKVINVSTSTNSDGTYNVYIGNGQQLVTRTQVTTLAAQASSADPARLTVALQNSVSSQELPESIITGGALGGLLQFRSEFLDKTSNELGRIAASMALTFNAQHALGQDLTGKISGDTGFVSDFFTVPTPKVVSSTLNPAAASAVTVSASFISPPPSNGTNFYTDLTNSDYRLTAGAAGPGALTLTRLSDNVQWTGADVTTLNAAVAASTQGSQGFTIAASAALVSGSSYLIQPTRDAALNIGVNSTIASDVRQIAVAAPIRTVVGTTNTGNATISAGSVATGYTTPASGSPVTLTYSGGSLTGFASYPVTVKDSQGNSLAGSPFAAGAVTFTNGATITSGGVSFSISGTPKDGDSFQIAKNTNGVSDGRNVLLLGKLQTQSTMSGGKASFQQAYAQLVSDAGNKGREVQVTLDAQNSLLTQSQSARDSLSGVNLDEEAANLLRYQQAYQAAAKMLDIGSKLFDSILALG
ncbi:MAG: flagellar hook-associated protein FlgK [Betaproteobacteria bacterium]